MLDESRHTWIWVSMDLRRAQFKATYLVFLPRHLLPSRQDQLSACILSALGGMNSQATAICARLWGVGDGELMGVESVIFALNTHGANDGDAAVLTDLCSVVESSVEASLEIHEGK